MWYNIQAIIQLSPPGVPALSYHSRVGFRELFQMNRTQDLKASSVNWLAANGGGLFLNCGLNRLRWPRNRELNASIASACPGSIPQVLLHRENGDVLSWLHRDCSLLGGPA